ncbi:MAG TPA: type IV pilin [Candidatus Thermoplasmatota archaeon]|nr:type IV pilin [Candidatus Thermoplasmatota archaeon]
MSGDAAVNEVVATVLMLGVTVALMGAAFGLFMNAMPAPSDAVVADLSLSVHPGRYYWGTGDEGVALAHRGGEPLLAFRTTVHVTISGVPRSWTGDGLVDACKGGFVDGALRIGKGCNLNEFTVEVNDTVDVVIVSGTSVVALRTIHVGVPPANLVPPPPTGLRASQDGNATRLTWTAPSWSGSPIIAYNVFRGTSEGNETYLGSSRAQDWTFHDEAAEEGVTYFYRVASLNDVGQGARSAAVSFARGGGS